MASPFVILRKHQKELMVIFTGMAMFSWLVIDSISGRRGGPAATPWVMVAFIALLGAGAGYIWNVRDKEQTNGWLHGAVVGAILGLVLMFASKQREQGIATSIGKISRLELKELSDQRQTANKFVAAALSQRENMQDFMFQFFYPRYALGGTSNSDLVEGLLLEREADQYGIAVSNDYINNFIDEVSDKRMDEASFLRVCDELQMSQVQVFDLLRKQLRIRVTKQLLNPASTYLPEQYWGDFCKFNVRHSIDAVPLPVDAFTASVDAPTDGDLKKLFDEFKSVYPMGSNPGFRVPEKKQLSYLVASFEAFEKQVGDVSEDDLKKLYEERKETFYKVESLPDSALDKAGKSGDEKASGKGGLTIPPPTKTTDDKPADEAKDGDKKPEPTKSEDKPADKPADDKKAVEEKKSSDDKKPTDEKAEDKKPESTEKASDETNSELKETQVSNPPPTAEPKVEPKADPKAEDKKPEDKKPEDKKPAADKPVTDKPAADKPADQPAGEKPATEKPAADAPATEKTDKPDAKADDKPADEKPTADKPAGEKKYKPFEDVRDELRESIVRQRAQEKLKMAVDAAQSYFTEELLRIGNKLSEGENLDKVKTQEDSAKAQKKMTEAKVAEIAKMMAAYGKENGFEFGETKLMSYKEFIESKDDKIASAAEPFSFNGGRFNEPKTIPNLIFATGDDRESRGMTMLVADKVEKNDGGTDLHFVYWISAVAEEREPKFEDEGIRDAVEKAWRLRKAQPAVEKRAADLVAEAKEKTLTEAFAETTVTGTKDAESVRVISTPPFSWLRQSTQGLQSNPWAPPTIEFGFVPGIDKIDNSFMKAISEMEKGEIKVLPNLDKSVYYIVQLKERTPSSDAADSGLRALHQNFLAEDISNSRIYGGLAGSHQQEVNAKWKAEFMRKYAVDINALEMFR